MNGYAGYILRINLTSGESKKEALSSEFVKKYIGGRGFAATILYDEVMPGTDPLGPDNKLIMASGPFAGVFLPAGAKTTFAAKSPASGGYGDSNIGGHLAAEMKYAGYDVIIFEGAAEKPVYVLIDDDRVEIRDAADLWGQGAIAVEQTLKKRLGDEFQIATIGPAGENLVYYACISHDIGRQAGRTGVGAVMGSKKIKAIAVRGTKTIPVADLVELTKIGTEMFATLNNSPELKVWQDYGLGSVPPWANSIGALPYRNFSSGHMEDISGLSGEAMRARITVSDKGCFACPMCTGKFSHDKKRNVFFEGPEYETTALIGGNCDIPNIEDVGYANYVCDEMGLDTISAGNAIGFAMECYEKGIITDKDTGGVQLKFGNVEAFARVAEMIARREGIGAILANGVRYAAGVWKQGSERFAIQIKGVEWSGYESRSAPANMLAYMTCDVGAHHNRAWAITYDIQKGREVFEGKAERVIELQHIRPVFDMLGTCRLQWVEMGLDLSYYARLFPAVTGIPYTWEDLLHVSERVWNLTRAFSARHIPGFGRAFDYPPPRFYEEKVPSGPTAGSVIPKEKLDAMLDEYYQRRGWGADGLPTKETLLRLDLPEVAKDFYGSGLHEAAITRE